MDSKTQRIWTLYPHLRMAVDQVDEGVIILDLQPQEDTGPRMVFLNRGIAALSGFDIENLLGNGLATLFGGRNLQMLLERFSAIAVNQGVFQISNPLLRADGSELDCLWKVSCVCDEKGEPLNFMLTLAREEKRVAGQADDDRVRVEMIEGHVLDDDQGRSERMETLALLAGGIAHDFKNMLTGVIGNLSLAREQVDDGKLGAQIDSAIEASRKGQEMAEHLLFFARGDGGERTEADVGRLLQKTAQLCTGGGSEARCQVLLGEDLWSATINVTRISQVISNLIFNARQAMNEQGIFQAKLTNVELTEGEGESLPAGPYLRLDVMDHGCGIPEEKLEEIFTLFYTTKDKGSGFGLATCQSVVREHGGSIGVVSKEGIGTCFTVFLPATGHEFREDKDPETGNEEFYRGMGRQILVVDDDPMILSTIHAILKHLDFTVVGVSSGEEGVSLFQRYYRDGSPFSAVLMDLTLPGGMNGDEATARILDIDPEARVIASSGYLSNPVNEEQREKGFAGALSKPYDISMVSDVLREVLEGTIRL
ncbi:MAG: ATP-binding protein [Verrucomicrobiota bacterium]|nr:ATP-binding protein [Verrucomicrobiota bacterium]